MHYVGIDVGKERCAIAILDENGNHEDPFTIENTENGYRELFDRLEGPAELAVEASTYTFALYQWFTARDIEVKVAHPRKVELIVENESKTDMNDAVILADLLRVGYLPESYLPGPDVLRLREVARDRREVGQELGRWKMRIQSQLDKHGIEIPFEDLWTQQGIAWLKEPKFHDQRDKLLNARVVQVEALEQRKDLLESVLAGMALDDERAHWLMSIPGCRWYLALYILGEVGEIDRFDDVDAFKRYSKCCPKEKSTGGRQDPYGVVQHGHSGLKWAFEMVAKNLITYKDNRVKQEYEKGMQATGDHGQAKARARRRTCQLVYTLLTKQETCRWSSQGLLDRKLSKARRVASA